MMLGLNSIAGSLSWSLCKKPDKDKYYGNNDKPVFRFLIEWTDDIVASLVEIL